MGFFSAVASFFEKKSSPEPASAPAPAPSPRDWIDEAELLEMVGGDRGLLQEMGRLFVSENDRRMVALHAALKQGDATGVREAAHGIKSGLTNFCAPEAVELAAVVEHAGREGVLANIHDNVVALERCLEQMNQQLQKMNGES